MKIEIGYDFENNNIIKNTKEYYGNSDEEMILNSIIEVLIQYFDKNDFKIASNTKDYLTLQYKNFDIARVKYTDKAKWISILVLDKEIKNKYEDDPLFEKQKNKNQLQWKSELKSNNINNYIEILIASCRSIK